MFQLSGRAVQSVEKGRKVVDDAVAAGKSKHSNDRYFLFLHISLTLLQSFMV